MRTKPSPEDQARARAAAQKVLDSFSRPLLVAPDCYERSNREARRPQSYNAFYHNLKGLGYAYWRVHGLNYLSSGEGAWDPLVPKLYRSNPPFRLPAPADQLIYRIMERYLHPQTKELSLLGRSCLLWVVLRPLDMYPLVYAARSYIRQFRLDPHRPGLGAGIEFFRKVAPSLREGCPGWDTEDRKEQMSGKMYEGLRFGVTRGIYGSGRGYFKP